MTEAPSFPLMANRPCNGGHLTPFLALYQQGVRLFHIDATCSEDIFHPWLRAWVGPDTFDYSAQEAYWHTLLEQCPEARFCLRLYVGSPPWWDEAHPEELQRYADGRTDHSFQRTDRRTVPSLASEAWKKDAVRSVEHFVEWLETSGWADKVWGLFLCYGITWEWGILGSDDFVGFSEPMRRRFRQELKATYGTDRALQQAWGNPAVSLDTAEVPDREARLRGDGDFRIFPRDRAAFDFQRCLSNVNADYLLALAGAARRKGGKRFILGTFYGYTLTAREHTEFMGRYGSGGLQGGHHALGRVLDSGLFDFLGSPYAYVNRDLEDGLLIEHLPFRSAQAHGVQVYLENDLWTFTTPPPPAVPISLGHTSTLEESITHQRLALAQALSRGTSYWWTELTEWMGPYAKNFSDPSLLEEIGRHVRTYQEVTGKGPASSQGRSQIALILDEESIDALALSSKLFLREVYQQLPAWSWSGAPFDVWLASDATAAAMAPYRLVYVFAPYLAQDRRSALSRSLCNSGRTVWWGPGTGLLTDQGRDAKGFEALTGFSDPAVAPGAPRRLAREGWNSLYGACAGLDAVHLAEIARQAGVHLFGAAPIQVMGAKDVIGVHVAKKGRYPLDLPATEKWRDLFSGRELEDGTFDFPARGVALFAAKGKR
jgi:hypothetical protein